jgi:hypothetical protein
MCGACMQTAPLSLLMLVAYPAVFQLHAAGWGGQGPDGGMVLPPTVPASSQYLEQHGAYLVDCGHICFLWVGQLVTPELVRVRLPPCLPPPLSSLSLSHKHTDAHAHDVVALYASTVLQPKFNDPKIACV